VICYQSDDHSTILAFGDSEITSTDKSKSLSKVLIKPFKELSFWVDYFLFQLAIGILIALVIDISEPFHIISGDFEICLSIAFLTREVIYCCGRVRRHYFFYRCL